MTAEEAEARLRLLGELADLWEQQQATYPVTPEGQVAAATVRCCVRELRTVLATGVLPESEPI